MNYSLFLGCTVPVRARNYEMSTRRVAEALGVKLVDVDGFVCCGFPVKSVHYESFLLTAASNLIVAEARDLDVCTLCSACTSVLTEVNNLLGRDYELRANVLRKLGVREKFRFGNSIRVRHFARILFEEVGLEKIRESVKNRLTGLKVAAHYGCHYLKPSEIYDSFDDPENPRSLDLLIEATGAQAVDYENKNLCCGAGILAMDERISFSMANKKLASLQEAQMDLVTLVCPFCSVMYDDNQANVESMFGVKYALPVVYYPQLLGLALGIDKKELGLNINRVKLGPLLERLAS
jgi:heterodisulfide reductase subunit B